MKTVTLLRHAKSDWNDTAPRDFDRPLNERGRRAADVMGRWASSQGLRFDQVIASPAVRVGATLAQFRESLGTSPEPIWDRRIYLASAAIIGEVIADTPASCTNLLLVGHSPGLEDFVLDTVADDAASPLRAQVAIKYPTAALAVLQFDITDWTSVNAAIPGSARLRAFVRPRDLDPSLGPDQR